MLIGIDIGGTKCAVIKAEIEGNALKNKTRVEFPTGAPEAALERIFSEVERLLPCEAIGISVGGPLDEERGIIMSPPNLPGWDNVNIVDELKARFGVPAMLRNDANACALAEWRFGFDKKYNNMVFLTFGTGLGAGVILDGKLYSGTNGNAGEVGHIRLSEDGPVGYGKCGSFEGFCSGGGITRLGIEAAREAYREGRLIFGLTSESEIENISTKMLAELAREGDRDAIAVFRKSGEMLGRGLSVIIDTLNPEAIVIGSVYQRAEELFREGMNETLKAEALGVSLGACEILPARLGDEIGDYAAISVAAECKELLSYSVMDTLVRRYPELKPLVPSILAAVDAIIAAHKAGGKVLLCGNGGSAADSEHIAGELLKGFLLKRTPKGDELEALRAELGEEALLLQSGVSAIPLPSITGAVSAFNNDVDASLTYAQMVYAIGRRGDVIILLSTSGNSKNVVKAARCARALGITTVSLTGKGGGALRALSDILIDSPECETYKVQEHHLPIYHAICAEVEARLFG